MKPSRGNLNQQQKVSNRVRTSINLISQNSGHFGVTLVQISFHKSIFNSTETVLTLEFLILMAHFSFNFLFVCHIMFFFGGSVCPTMSYKFSSFQISLPVWHVSGYGFEFLCIFFFRQTPRQCLQSFISSHFIGISCYN